jgi:hypothetical protein
MTRVVIGYDCLHRSKIETFEAFGKKLVNIEDNRPRHLRREQFRIFFFKSQAAGCACRDDHIGAEPGEKFGVVPRMLFGRLPVPER